MAWVYRVVTGQPLDPDRLNPYPRRRPPPRRATEASSREGWVALDAYFQRGR